MSSVIFRVEGQITGFHVEELRKACDVYISRDGVNLSLELADISFPDSAGIVLLTGLRRRGIDLMHVTPFLVEWLKDEVAAHE